MGELTGSSRRRAGRLQPQLRVRAEGDLADTRARLCLLIALVLIIALVLVIARCGVIEPNRDFGNLHAHPPDPLACGCALNHVQGASIAQLGRVLGIGAPRPILDDVVGEQFLRPPPRGNRGQFRQLTWVLVHGLTP
ncbi:hypothetical protein QTH97_07950 [Variovorax sp. J22R24]|nr:hypothetical protein [Variovorax sp. J22R24]MDM0104862.1 hypothetical protein [Variovorax sp. J22R24]